MSFIEQAYLEIKTIDASITATEFSTKIAQQVQFLLQVI